MKKTLVIIIHVLAVLAFTAGICALYADSSGREGIAWISAGSYEDSPQFAAAADAGIADVKRLAFLYDAFGEEDMLYDTEGGPRVVAEASVSGDRVSYTVPELLAAASGFGDLYDPETGEYSFSTEPPAAGLDYDVRVVSKVWNPDFLEKTEPGPSQGMMGIRELEQELIRCLSEYHQLTAKYRDRPSNFLFSVDYPSNREEYVIISNTELGQEELSRFGRYVFASGTESSVVTNIRPEPKNAVYVPLSSSDPSTDEYYRLSVGIDTAWPYEDGWRSAALAFSGKTEEAWRWVIISVAAAVVAVITLVLILREASEAYSAVNPAVHSAVHFAVNPTGHSAANPTVHSTVHSAVNFAGGSGKAFREDTGAYASAAAYSAENNVEIIAGSSAENTPAGSAGSRGEKPEGGFREEKRHRLDRLPFEVFVVLMAALAVLFYFLFKSTLFRAIAVLAPYSQEQFYRTVAKTLITYGLIILILRSAIRRYRSGLLYENSVFCRLELAIEAYLEKAGMAGNVLVRFLFFAAANLGGTVLACRLYAARATDSRKSLLALVIIAAVLILDALTYDRLFRTAVQRDSIGKALKGISGGETGGRLEERAFSGPELEMARDINHISVGLSNAVQDQVRSERLKADLITNVSHDIKTPLTSIISYVGLLKRENIQNEKAREYISVLEKKSERLKNLTEDLVEASKASSGNVRIEYAKIDIAELTAQAAAEFEDKFGARKLEFCFTRPEEPVFVRADGRHLWRVFENLFNNASKYSLEGTRIYGSVAGPAEREGRDTVCVFTIKNISAMQLNISPEELTERFVRGDLSRTTEGSGLGLSIAKSLTSLMGGELKIEIDGDLYKASVILQAYTETEES